MAWVEYVRSIEQELIAFRHEIHAHPTLSNEEGPTADRVAAELERCGILVDSGGATTLLRGIGGHGMVLLNDPPKVDNKKRMRMVFRCELDALPIAEPNTELAYCSTVPNVSHKCGHDGHMAMCVGLARLLQRHPPSSAAEWQVSTAVLFQPAEEIGEGAARMVRDDAFVSRVMGGADAVVFFALHNLPESTLNTVQYRHGVFACASRGLKLSFQGKTAHAATPHNGVPVGPCVAECIQMLDAAPRDVSSNPLCMATIVHVKVGDGPNYGIAPGAGEIHVTLRTEEDGDMAALVARVEERATALAAAHRLKLSMEYTDVFNSVHCTRNAVNAVVAATEDVQRLNELELSPPLLCAALERPMSWSEDFGVFSNAGKVANAFFGYGTKPPATAGGSEKTAFPLHHHRFNFVDSALLGMVSVMYSVACTVAADPPRALQESANE